MKSLLRIISGIFISLVLLPCLARGGESSVTTADYRDRLHQFVAGVDSLDEHPEQASQLLTEIPDELTVKTGTRDLTVNFRDLKNDLTSFGAADAAQRPERLKQIKNYLEALQQEAEANAASPVDHSADQKKVGDILSRREFHKVRRPGAKEALLARFFRWLSRWLGKLHIGNGTTNNFLQGLVYTVVGLALLVALFWTIRSLRRKDEEMLPREIMPFSPSAKNWRTWLAEARQSAAGQDWRNAIHLAYWAGISSLESGGAWKPNRARTPREYLRLLSTRNPNHPPLSALTKKFEVVWYGERVAGETDFQEALTQLEQLGCR